MNSHKLYLTNTYTFEAQATVVGLGQDEKGNYIVLDQTIFYPQGGGQPSDQGVVKYDGGEIAVVHVRQVDDEVRHYINDTPGQDLQNLQVLCSLDQARRMLNSRYHTAAHLLSTVVEHRVPELKAVKGHSFPGEGYVEFHGQSQLDVAEIETALTDAIQAGLCTMTFDTTLGEFEDKYYKLPYSVPPNKAFRVMQIGDYLPVPCGGTHLANTSELGHLKLGKVKYKGDVARVGYELT